ncbi:hypothetical protein WOLCODRAFT_140140 [Wolfiporia cocos MD-104 SS10]|uniref:Small secreted protein n=1 Tax=Wolfiporia cocos (strain MD-104) TaxID=742152 RepID=A0A2H3J145_WOLCO|nr:hypothetical protein WOLCODRAFT_140140 [Wolfiporia cocos MD-104 SS10]
MARLSVITFAFPAFVALAAVLSAPVSFDNGVHTLTKYSTGTTFVAESFKAQSYNDFQISDGVAGDAQSEANAVFVDPFDGVDLSTVDSNTVQTMNTMREAAESAETDEFDPQIEAASGSEATELQNGKIKNKVLKLTGEVQVLNIKIAQAQAKGEDTSDLESDLADEQAKLETNIATDVKNAGQVSKGVTVSS